MSLAIIDSVKQCSKCVIPVRNWSEGVGRVVPIAGFLLTPGADPKGRPRLSSDVASSIRMMEVVP